MVLATISLQDVAETKNLKEELDSSQKMIDDVPNLTIKHASAEETLVGEVDGGCEESSNLESPKLEVGLDSMYEAQVQEPHKIEYHKRIENAKNSDNLFVNEGSGGKSVQEDKCGDEHVTEAEHSLKQTAPNKQIEISMSHENTIASENIRKSGNEENHGEYEIKGEGSNNSVFQGRWYRETGHIRRLVDGVLATAIAAARKTGYRAGGVVKLAKGAARFGLDRVSNCAGFSVLE